MEESPLLKTQKFLESQAARCGTYDAASGYYQAAGLFAIAAIIEKVADQLAKSNSQQS